ncbi:MAG: tRNA sulfurtransferase [Candidatus Aenigmatarchaeota archaeon]
MEADWILIRYGEIGLKSDHVRRSFEDRLIHNIHEGLKSKEIKENIKRGYGRIFVNTKEVERASEVLKRTFGIVSFSPCEKMDASFEKITERLAEVGEENIESGESFAVRVRRTGSHDFSSKDVEEVAGAKILKRVEAEVDLDEPDKKIMAEVRQGQCYIFTDKIEGPGGLPLGTQGKVVSLLKGGYKSFLATWLMMKRGCSVVALHGNLGPYAQGGGSGEVVKELRKWSHGSPVEALEFDHSDNIFTFSEEGKRGMTCVLCKRFLYRLASKVADKRNAKAVISGESIGNNLKRMSATDSVSDLPIIRPLVGLGREKIKKKCREITGRQFTKPGCEAEDSGISEFTEEELKEVESETDVENMIEEKSDEVLKVEDTQS